MPQLQRRLWNLLRTPRLFYFLGYLPYRFFLSLSLGDDQISGFRRERVWLIFTRPVKNSIPLCVHHFIPWLIPWDEPLKPRSYTLLVKLCWQMPDLNKSSLCFPVWGFSWSVVGPLG